MRVVNQLLMGTFIILISPFIITSTFAASSAEKEVCQSYSKKVNDEFIEKISAAKDEAAQEKILNEFSHKTVPNVCKNQCSTCVRCATCRDRYTRCIRKDPKDVACKFKLDECLVNCKDEPDNPLM